MKVALSALALLPALAACSMTIDESTVFAPRERESRAQTAEELANWPADHVLAAAPDARIEHGFIGGGDVRVAFTLAARDGAARPLIVHCGGNAADRYNSGSAYIRKALAFGDVLIFDYPGYGDSPGVPTGESMQAMAARVSAFATERAGARGLVFWGHSLGGFVCAQMAGATPAADGVVLETTARSASEVADAWTPWYAAPFVRIDVAQSLASYDVAQALAGFDGAVLVLGARRDDTLPVSLSRSLNDALRQAGAQVTYVEFADAAHFDVPQQPDFAPTLSAFFARLPQQAPSSP